MKRLGIRPELDWSKNIVACPKCKRSLTRNGQRLSCANCRLDFSVENDIAVLLAPELVKALDAGREVVKHFYYREEKYDWTSDPRGLELAYHRYRKWETWRQVERFLRAGIVVLDVGCGTGLITSEFPKRYQKVVAIDMNRWALSRMDGKPFVVKVQGDGESLPILDESIDLIVATEMIEHLEAPERTAAEMYRVCKKGGHIVGTVPSTSVIWKWRRYLSMTCGGGEPFHHNYKKSEIAKLWQNSGFKVDVRSSCLGMNWLWTLEKV